MKSRFTALALVSLMTLAACEDATTPDPGAIEIGRPNIAIAYPDTSYGFVDGFATFLKPLVADPFVDGETLNQNLLPIIEVWKWDDVLKEERGVDHGCVSLEDSETGLPLYGPVATFTPQVNFDETYYEYGWKTDREPAGGLIQDSVYRICVKILRVVPGGDAVRQLVLWRDVIPAQTNNPNNPEGNPYEFQNGSNIPIKFWISSKSLCFDEGGNVIIDCTIATFGSDGGTATCDAAQCGISAPGSGAAIPEGKFATFEVRYVNCGVTDPDGTIDYLPIDIPQYPGCLTVTVTANFAWSSFDQLGPGLVAAACRDETVLGPRDERLLLHIESADATEYYALPTRQFDLECGPQPLAQAPGPSGTVGDWMRYYATRGVQAMTQPVRSLFAPPELTAAHAGFGGGTSLGCNGASTEGPDGVINCSSPVLAAAAAETTVDVQPGVPVEFRMVWALPSKISARLKVIDEDPFTTAPWIDPELVVNGTLFPAVLVTDECELDSGVDQFGNPVVEDCVGQEEDQPVSGATVTFTLPNEPPVTVTRTTGADGIAYAPWPVTGNGLFEATASGLGIGVDPSLDSVTVPPPAPPAVGAYQDHVGDTAVMLQSPSVLFQGTACPAPATLDGIVSLEEYATTSSFGGMFPFMANVSGGEVEAAVYWMTDCDNLYMAVEILAGDALKNSVRIIFDNDGDDITETFDDIWVLETDRNGAALPAEDWHLTANCLNKKQSSCGEADPAPHGPLLTDYFFSTGTGSTVFELKRSLNSDGSDPYDFSIQLGQTLGFYVVVQMGNGAQGNSEYPDFRVYERITIGQ
ncbi:MAG: hypothetical protein OER90_13555 [Gemmatimonadota bacterium]|nr:hypothetical protein [Gemmatimonadota bacterium]